MRATRREAIAAAAVLAVAPAAAWAASDEDQLHAALTAALELEQTAVVAYEAIANSGRLSDHAAALMRALRDDDSQHAEQLVKALEDEGVKPPIPPRRATIAGLSRVRGDAGAARFAMALEHRTVAAYADVVRVLHDANLLRIIAGAMGTDGQHLVVLRQLAGTDPVPRAFERGTGP